MGLDCAIVTGSTSGIGLGIARRLAASGYGLLLNGFGEAREIGKLCKGLADEHGVAVIHSPADMREPAEIEGMIGQAQSEFSRIAVLVNNAGIQFTAPVHAFPIEQWDSIIAINLTASFHAIRAVLPAMLAAENGRIINIASTHGLVASREKAAYVAAKHGLVGLTKVVALETAGQGITCNAICPGWVLTPLVEKQIADRATQTGITIAAAKQALLAEKQPSGEFVTAEQIGDLVVFLASPAADQLTGQALAVDGGWTAQ